MAALSEVADLIMGQSPPSATYNEGGDGLAFFQGKTDFGFRYPTPRLFCNAPLKIAKPHDILMSVRAPVGPTNIADRVCCIGRGLAAIRPRAIDGDFLFFNLRYVEKFIASLGSGSTFHAINKSQLASVEVNAHDFNLPEQQKIAGVLGLVQRAMEQQDRLIALTKELKKTLLHQLFTQGLRGQPQKQTEIGLVPESWEVVRLGDVAKLQSGGTPARDKPEYWIAGDIPWVKTGQIDYRVIHMTEERISREGLANSAAKVFPKGTLLIAMYGQGVTRGRVGLLGIDAATNQACAAITPDDEKRVSTPFIYHFLEFHYEDLRQMGHGANQRNLNAALIKGFRLSFPKPDEQAQIVEALGILNAKLTIHQSKHAAHTALFRTLLHHLMTAQIRVKDDHLPNIKIMEASNK